MHSAFALQVFFYTGAHGVQMFDVCHGWRVAIMSSMADISDTARAGYRQGCTSVDQLWFKLHVELSSMLPEEERRQEMQWIFYPKRPGGSHAQAEHFFSPDARGQ
eukprot:TRINITY_DN3148_c0_g1_i2.p2 TRINITY_DN3148_c0_g1~~TRINITY_DN3148_c0_g1_i2.p2  ORF type:complete len:105 (-),score=21.42 TRINITY_DN3148_c0_g1_i2:116-430(-)